MDLMLPGLQFVAFEHTLEYGSVLHDLKITASCKFAQLALSMYLSGVPCDPVNIKHTAY